MNIKFINLLRFILIFLIIRQFIWIITTNSSFFSKTFNYQQLTDFYQHSQFAQTPEDRINIIQDEDLYAYSGWHYLTTSQLDSINIEHPPLGKYLIGLSILLTGNQNIGQIFWGLCFTILLYLLGKKIMNNSLLALLAVLLFTQEALFKEQMTHSLLDLIQGVFLLILLLITLLKPKYRIFYQGISLGCIASIKFPSIALIALITLFIYNFLQDKKSLIKNTLTISFVCLAVYLLSYSPFFIKYQNPIHFYNLQLRALKIQLSHVPEYPKGQVFNVLLFDRWLSWWGTKDFIKSGYWNIMWPVLIISFVISLRTKFKKNLLINLWIISYLCFIASRLFFPRYLLLLLPFLYLNLCYNFKSLNIFKDHES